MSLGFANMEAAAGRRPQFVWLPEGPCRRNAFVLFERCFDLDRVPPEFLISLFADTRYRLRVNGEYVSSGPARFVTSHPEFDTHDLAPDLRAGRNVIAVEVNFYGASSFQTMPDGRPGFIAWGGGGGIDLATPGDWRGAELPAWQHDAPLFSFAQGPVEICDTRRLEPGEWVDPVRLTGENSPWGPLAPYSGRTFRRENLYPAELEVAGSLRESEHLVACVAHDPAYDHSRRNKGKKPFSAMAVWIRSPHAQKVTVSYFWAELFLNGRRVLDEQADDSDGLPAKGNHQRAELNLRGGGNLLACSFEVLTEYWSFLLGFPSAAGLTLAGLPDERSVGMVAVMDSVSRTRPSLPLPDEPTLPEGWSLRDKCPPNLTPARVCGWDVLEEEAGRSLSAALLSEMSPIKARAAAWCLRFDGEFLGHPVIEVEAPEGSILDVACDDWQTPEGMTSLYKSNPFTDSVDRFVLRGGFQRVELFHTRGGKFLQVTLRSPGAPAPLHLYAVFVRSRQTAGQTKALLQCGHEALDWTFERAATTLEVSTGAAYADCPWRERGMYIGDALVCMHLDLLMHSDQRTARRMLRQFAQARREDGLLPACAPSWLRYSFDDYTLLWILALRDFWALTGDLEIVQELWPVVQGIWSSPAWSCGNHGLWDAAPETLFIDWGVLPDERTGAGNAVLNILRIGALRASSEMARALGEHAVGKSQLAGADSVEQALFADLWIDAEARLAPSVGNKTSALHANLLALCFRVGSEAQRVQILKFLEPMLMENFRQGIAYGQFSGHAELYFFYFLLPALASHGRADLAEHLISEHYGYLKSVGDDTLPECFSRCHRGIGSRCHSWSGGPAIYAARHVLGIQSAEPGNPKILHFRPTVSGISSASGRIAHSMGWIDVDWRRRDDGSFAVHWSAPEGVKIVPDPRIRAGNLSTFKKCGSQLAEAPSA